MLRTLKHRVKERLGRWEERLHEPVGIRLERTRPADGPPVLILAAPFSGAEQVTSMLERHPRFACARDTLFMVGLLATLKEKNCVTGYSTVGVSPDAARANIRVLARNYYERLLYVSGKARWVDSTSYHALFTSELDELFAPDVRFVHVVRHGVDVAHAIADADGTGDKWGYWVDYFHQGDATVWTPGHRLQAAASLWQAYNRTIHEFAQRRPEACHLIRSEVLLANPEPAARALFEFLGEHWTPGVLDGLQRDSAGHPPRSRRDGSVDERAIHDQLAADLERYGYDATNS